MKYEKEIDNLLREILFEDWMSEDEYNEVIFETFMQLNTSKEKLSKELEIGVKNGYSIELQFDMIKSIINK
jgi:hypothetical protein